MVMKSISNNRINYYWRSINHFFNKFWRSMFCISNFKTTQFRKFSQTSYVDYESNAYHHKTNFNL